MEKKIVIVVGVVVKATIARDLRPTGVTTYDTAKLSAW
jgi:hypothetical protein